MSSSEPPLEAATVRRIVSRIQAGLPGVACVALAVAALHLAGARELAGVEPAADDLAEARRFAAARFRGSVEKPAPLDAGLLAIENHGSVQKNSRGDKPLRIGVDAYTRGLYCHAPSGLLLRLPGPGKTLTAVVGVDSNDQTRPGRGSVVFSIKTAEKEIFRSRVLREGDGGLPVKVELDGASGLELHVTDAGDGISCDQADWADLKVSLADGKSLWVADLPLVRMDRPAPSLEPPFSFILGGKPSSELLKDWDLKRESRLLEGKRTEHVQVWTDLKSGLSARCVAVEHDDFPAVEWTLHLRNGGTAESPIFEDIQAMDVTLDRGLDGEFVLHHNRGDSCAANSFEPLETTLGPNAEVRFAPAGGRPSNGAWPYFNVHWGGEGVLVAIGWPGQWAASFRRDEKSGLRITAGQEAARFKLLPGEEVRSPLGLLMFYEGDWLRGQNIWRKWMLSRVFPKPAGGLLSPTLAACSGWHFPGLMCNQAGEIEFIDRYLEEGIRLDYWWMDAGWYPCEGTGWPKVGTWEVDRKRYPGGLRAVTDHARQKGIGSVVWFEPERVHAGTWLAENRPEWILGGSGGGLLNLGNPEARKWITDRIDRLISEEGITLYRQDFNIDPLTYWRGNDPPDRQGITEIRHVEGYLAFWDELRRRHPGMLIDSCASGGRRNDIETMRRAVPLLRTDFEFHSAGNQCHTYGFDLWLPFHECGNRDIDIYSFRSNMGPMMGFVWDARRRDLDYDLARKLIAQWREVADCYFGDFYPLTRYSTEEDVWMAWQFDRPDLDMGLVQAFRRGESIYESARLVLRGLDPDAAYTVRNLDSGPGPEAGGREPKRRELTAREHGHAELTGRDLMRAGLPVSLPDRPGAALVVYKKIIP